MNPTQPGAILLLGGTGKIASRIAPQVQSRGYHTIQASRSGNAAPGCEGCHFDWLDSKTYANPFEKTPNITRVFIVAPPIVDMFPPMKEFIDLAKSRGVRRFVLLSASSLPPGGPAMGLAHQYLTTLGVEFAVLRPSWFMEKFSDKDYLNAAISEGKIYSATGDGRIPWIAADDIAAVGCHALCDEVPWNGDRLLLGPELLSYTDVAEVLTDITRKPIQHQSLTEDDYAKMLSAFMPPSYASMLARLDTGIAAGAEERLNDVVEKILGRRPMTFREFAEVNIKPHL